MRWWSRPQQQTGQGGTQLIAITFCTANSLSKAGFLPPGGGTPQNTPQKQQGGDAGRQGTRTVSAADGRETANWLTWKGRGGVHLFCSAFSGTAIFPNYANRRSGRMGRPRPRRQLQMNVYFFLLAENVWRLSNPHPCPPPEYRRRESEPAESVPPPLTARLLLSSARHAQSSLLTPFLGGTFPPAHPV
jgi:hypothetical protein